MFEKINHYGIQTETIASIGQFAVLWGMVEEAFFEKCCITKKLGRLVVVKSTDAIAEYAESIKNNLISYYSGNEDIYDRLNLRSNDGYFSEKVRLFLQNDAISVEDKTSAAVCICFRIRNNMFHGEKVFWLLDRQKPLIDSCSCFLNELLMENALQIMEAQEV